MGPGAGEAPGQWETGPVSLEDNSGSKAQGPSLAPGGGGTGGPWGWRGLTWPRGPGKSPHWLGCRGTAERVQPGGNERVQGQVGGGAGPGFLGPRAVLQSLDVVLKAMAIFQ